MVVVHHGKIKNVQSFGCENIERGKGKLDTATIVNCPSASRPAELDGQWQVTAVGRRTAP